MNAWSAPATGTGAAAPIVAGSILAQSILDFWFLPLADEGHGRHRREWFRKDAAFDAQIGARFGAAIATALAGGLAEWDADGPAAALARILLLDQFTRNVHRGTSAAFAGDALARAAALALLESGAASALLPVQRAFVYMPLEHAEDLAMQDLSVALFTALAAQAPGFDGMLDFARRHRDVIARFGRFPHRNAILGRESTAGERIWLKQPGSGF